MSNEASGLLENHIENKGIAYPIAKVKGENADRIYGVKGFPSAALVDATGRVIWTGHPGSLPMDEVKKALEGAAFLPRVEGKEYKKIDKYIGSRDYGKAYGEVEKGLAKNGDDETLTEVKANLDGLLERMNKRATSAVESSDFGVALGIYDEIEDYFSGHEASKVAKEAAKAVEKNPEAKDELDAWKKIVKADEAQFEGDYEKAAKLYGSIAKKYGETKSGARAQDFLTRHRL